ncbi:MAG: sugar ABC transporter substrate-binding protein [Clostridiales Family XIII bacterium]|jgi:ABC-type sugar transport system substrate-binding protein|nr:sugar ABC transporter substrate-binding protein [Clostridiales Family XIII bacterium]
MISVFSFGLAACEGGGGESGGGESNTGDPVNTDDITVPTEFKGKNIYEEEIKIAYLPIGTEGPAFVMADYAIKDCLKFNDNIKVDIYPSEYDPNKQASSIQEAITQGYDGIMLEAMDPVVSAGPIEEAEAAGIPVITINLNSEALHTLHIQGNDYISGCNAARTLGEACGGKGKALTLNGPAAQQATSQMVPGFNETIAAEFPDIEILGDLPVEGWQSEVAETQMRDALTKYDQIDIVYCASDDLADGAIKAIKAAGREKDIKVHGSMGYPAALKRIKDGTQFASYYSDGYAEYTTVIFQMLYFIQNGMTASALGLTATPLIDQPTTPITKENVETVIETSHWREADPTAGL